MSVSVQIATSKYEDLDNIVVIFEKWRQCLENLEDRSSSIGSSFQDHDKVSEPKAKNCAKNDC